MLFQFLPRLKPWASLKQIRENDSRAGERLENLSFDQYDEAYTQVINILADEHKMPSNVKRNILVKMGR